MKCKVLMLSHSNLAGAFYDTIKFIYGDTSGFGYINMSEPFDQQEYIANIEKVIVDNKDTGIIILTDLFGGSPFLNTCKLMKQYGQYIEVITGYNLAMVLELAGSIQTDSVSELKQKALQAGCNGIIDVKERMK
ncbi:MAG: PTS sugar transporter subunit IIA [Erysipelotrichaceae bacterium]